VGYPRIDLELSAARAKFRSIDASIRELDEEIERVCLEASEIQAGLLREAEWHDCRAKEIEREVRAAVASGGTWADSVRLAAAAEIFRKAGELAATSTTRLAVWRERNDACKRKNDALDRKRQRFRLVFDKFRYLHRAALPMPLAHGGRTGMAAARPGGPHYYDDDDLD
jgi:hypothetical protein